MKEHKCKILREYEKITSQSKNAWYYQFGKVGETDEFTMLINYCMYCGIDLDKLVVKYDSCRNAYHNLYGECSNCI